MVVNNNAPGTQARAREGSAPDGRRLVEVVVEAVKRDMGAGGFDGALGARFGARPTGKRR